MVDNNLERQNKADVILVTVTEVETDAVISSYKDRTGLKPTIFHGQHNSYFDLGEIGGAQVRLVQSSGMGSGGELGSQTTVTDAITDLSPSDIIMVGIAFGIDPVKTEIGKVLISEHLQDYNLQKIGTDASGQPLITPRRPKVTASGRMISRFRIGARFWNEGEGTELGLILSGDKLIDNVDYRQTLETLFPGTIGGEMEGAGLYAAAVHHKKDWIVVKAVCDYADGNKGTDKETRQALAAKNAADFTFSVLEQRGFAPIGPARPISQNFLPSIPPMNATPDRNNSTTNLSSEEQIIEAIHQNQPNLIFLVRNYMDSLVNKIDQLDPKFPSEGVFEVFLNPLIEAIERTRPLLVEFASIAKTIVATGNLEIIRCIYQGFKPILEEYNYRNDHRTHKKTRLFDFDFFRFVGHEFFVTFFAFLLRYERWEIIEKLLEEDFFLENPLRKGSAGLVSFEYISQYTELFGEAKMQGIRFKSRQEILKLRHTEKSTDGNPNIAELIPLIEFMEADYFLFLRGELQKSQDDGWATWKPWSSYYLLREPSFLAKSIRKKYADKLLGPLGVKSIEELRQLIMERAPKLSKMVGNGWGDHPLRDFNLQQIGTL